MQSSFLGGVSQAALVINNLSANTGDIRDMGSIPGLGRSPGREKQQATLVFLPDKFHRQEEPGGESLWGHKESNMTE